MSRQYQIHEFASLAGVTVKALHHYDRLGLLKPKRTAAGYRLYAEKDLERLEQIVALKFLGLPLMRIKGILDNAPLGLRDALRMQREALQAQQALLTRAIGAIQAAEEALDPGGAASPSLLKTIIKVINMQNGIEMMKQYYSEEAWARRQRYYQQGPSPEWRELYHDIEQLLGEDPGGEKAQAVAGRWLALSLRAYTGDPEVQTDSMTAWMDRNQWPPAMKDRIAQFKLEEVTAFLEQTAISSRKKYFTAAAWAKWLELRKQPTEDFSNSWQAQVDLFHDVEDALAETPSSEKAKSLAARWLNQMDKASHGYPDVKAGLMNAWKDRRNWPPVLRWQTEGLTRLPFDRFEKAADFLDRTAAAMKDPAT